MSNPFFLTRQCANLMEDFARETRAGAALFLLYGDAGVGKTRLLQELKQTRLAEVRVHWVNLASEDPGSAPGEHSARVEQLFESAQAGDIIIADHFEAALKKTRHQLFVSWSTDGLDKGLGLIIASRSEGFNELRQLSAQYQVRVQSYQLMPLSGDEIDAFLGSYLFPDHPIGKLSMPAPLRKQIAGTRGVIGKLIEIADHDGSHISTQPLTDDESLRQGSRIVVAVLLLFALAVGTGWYLFGRPAALPAPGPLVETAPPASSVDTVTQVDTVTEPVIAPVPEPVPEPEAGTGPFATGVNAEAETDDAVEPAGPLMADGVVGAPAEQVEDVDASSAEIVEQFPAIAAAELPVESGAPAAPVAREQMPNASTQALQSSPEDSEMQAAEASETVAIAAPAEAASVTLATPATTAQRLLQELQRSLDWIYNRDETVGTIQILLLGYDSFDADAYFDYVARLEAQQVDTAKLRIFKTLTGDRVFYSVVYGEYVNRADANRAIPGLPARLREAGPIPRSVGGIWEEMQRLDTIN